MQREKAVFVEPKSKVELPTMLAEFDKVIRSGQGAAFFAVCRGKVSRFESYLWYPCIGGSQFL